MWRMLVIFASSMFSRFVSLFSKLFLHKIGWLDVLSIYLSHCWQEDRLIRSSEPMVWRDIKGTMEKRYSGENSSICSIGSVRRWLHMTPDQKAGSRARSTTRPQPWMPSPSRPQFSRHLRVQTGGLNTELLHIRTVVASNCLHRTSLFI